MHFILRVVVRTCVAHGALYWFWPYAYTRMDYVPRAGLRFAKNASACQVCRGVASCWPSPAKRPRYEISPTQARDPPQSPLRLKRGGSKLSVEITQWETKEFADIMEDDFELPPDVDEVELPVTLPELTDRLIEKVDATTSQWVHKPSAATRRALLILGLYLSEKLAWNGASELLVSRALCVVFRHELRAHSDSVYRYLNGAWRAIESIPQDMIRIMEETLVDLEALLDAATFIPNLPKKYDAVFAALADSANGIVDQSVSTHRDPAEPRQENAWAREASKRVMGLSLRFSGANRGKDLAKTFGNWFVEPRPPASGVVCFKDACLQAPDFSPLRKAAGNNCYTYIPTALHYKAADDDVDRLRKFFITTFAGSPGGRAVCISAEALALYGKPFPHVIIVLQGTGKDGKGSLAILRANVFGESHRFVSADCLQVDQEWRRQGCQLANASCLTIQEVICTYLVPYIHRHYTRS